jgi:transcriptional regulator with XRE-family HTH domain
VLPFCRLTLTAAKPKDSAYPASLTTLGDHIRARRLDLGLTQEQAASRIICTEATITNWELNRVQPAIRYLPGIIRFLGYDPNRDRVPQSLGDRLKAHRKRLGLSREKLALLLGTDESNLAGWETGRHRPTNRSLALIAEFLATPTDSETSGKAGASQADPNLFS